VYRRVAVAQFAPALEKCERAAIFVLACQHMGEHSVRAGRTKLPSRF